MRRWAMLFLGCALGFGGHARAQADADVLFLRDGSSLRGNVLQESDTSYMVSSFGRSRNVLKTQVRFVVYGSPERTAERLDFDAFRQRHMPDAEPIRIEVLTAADFGEALREAIAGARRSIYLTTFTLSGGDSGPAREIFNLLLEKGRDKKTVVLLAPVGIRTPPAVRTRSINLGQQLEEQGLSVRFLETAMLQHKKLVIVDNATVFIGSSNLTNAGLSENREVNLRITDPAFVAAARRDFDSLRRRSKRWRDLQR